MKTRLPLALLLLAVLSGCSTLARGGAAGATAPDQEEEEDLGPFPMTDAAPAAGPGTMEVAWEDNGVPLRQLTGDGRPYEMKVPESSMAKKGRLAAPQAQATTTR